MSYNRARLLLGMSSVGTWVVLAVILLFVSIEPWQLLMGYLLISLPFDLLGGQLLPCRFGQTTPNWWAWLISYGRGLMVHTSLLVTTFFAFSWAGQYRLLLPVAALWALLLIAGQAFLARVAGAIHFTQRSHFEGKETVLVESAQPGFTGGVTGLPGHETILLPALWSPEVGEVALCRRKLAINKGARTLGVLVGLLWNLGGLALLAPSGPLTSLQLTQLSAAVTLWSFLGLLLLPSVARLGVRWMDAQTVRRVGWPAFQVYLDAMTDEAERAQPISESIFYPIPSREARLQGLQSKKRSSLVKPWYPARTALFLSVGGLSLLSRAVHCNIGRPALWFFPPCD